MMQNSFSFPQSLTEKYRPTRISDFVGIPKAKKLCANLAANPREINLIFAGASGTGKTTLALALAQAIPAELHHIPSSACNLEEIMRVRRICQYYPNTGFKMHMVLVDEADQASRAAQIAMLSILDSTNHAPNTIFVFTCNTTDGLEPRFLSRCLPVEFSSYGISSEAVELLKQVWAKEAPQGAKEPDYVRLVKNATNNIRAALMSLESELLCA